MLVLSTGVISPATAQHVGEEEDDEPPNLREQLTEREDKIFVEDPYVLDLFGRPLSIIIQSESLIEGYDELVVGDPSEAYGQLVFEHEVEVEGFYSFGSGVSALVQVNLLVEEDLDSGYPDAVSDLYLERGEMWLYFQEIGGSDFHLELGRLDFEDDRLWWWDMELDAVRVAWETDELEITLAVARELFSARSDRHHIDPEHDDVTRVIMEASWDWHEDHAIQVFFLHSDDRSRTGSVGDLVREEREDEFDGDLYWAGIRFAGGAGFGDGGIVGYWVDVGGVWGDELIVESDDLAPGLVELEEIRKSDVCAWAVDAGSTILIPVALEPRLTLAYAMGSGDSDPEAGRDGNYRQTTLHENEPGFGGAQRFKSYGFLLDPELSNLSVATVGLGISLFESSSLDLVYHNYRLMEHAEGLRDARIEEELTGDSRDIGHGIDLILALEEWERMQFELVASTFRAGRAFGDDEGEWIFGGFAAFRMAF